MDNIQRKKLGGHGMEIIIFGAGRWGRQCLTYFMDHTEEYHVVELWDNNPATHGRMQINNSEVPIFPPPRIYKCLL